MVESSSIPHQNSSPIPIQNGTTSHESMENHHEGLFVDLSGKTLALIRADKEDPNESDDDEKDKVEIPERQKNMFHSVLNVLGENRSTPRSTRLNITRKRHYVRRLRDSVNNPFECGLNEHQLAAPYVEEQLPDQPEYLQRNSIESNAPLLNEGEQSEGITNGSNVTISLRGRVKKALAAHEFQQMAANPDNTRLENAGDFPSIMLPIAISIPYLWARRDHEGRKAPPIIFEALKLAITDSRADEHMYNLQTLYRIELEYGDVKWVIQRTAFDFSFLDFSLRRKNDLPEIPTLPTNITSWVGTLFHRTATRHAKQQELALERRKKLQSYLIQLIKALNRNVSYTLNEFLELSAISITRDMGMKGKEGYVENKVDKFDKNQFCFWRKSSNETWEREWVIVRDSYIAFCTHISSTTPADVFLLDKYFKCTKLETHGLNKVLSRHDTIFISNSSRKIELRSESRTLNEITESIDRVKGSSPWVKQHRFDSYAPKRDHAKVKWYVDGKDYFLAVSQAILTAKSEIYIEDWWLSPELYLRRPPHENEEFRLDRLLKKKAEEGVMIYIVVYKEVKLALTLDSNHTKQTLQSLHPNIKVQRHPDHGPDGVMFWAHHEKMVVVDSEIAFIGGLDLCFGRYDTHVHQLSDSFLNEPGDQPIWLGQDYSNPRVKDFANVANWLHEAVDKKNVPRMPWHDVSIGMVGPPARDVARHFVQRWNFIKDEKSYDNPKFPFLTPKGEYVNTRDESRFRGTCEVQLLRSSAEWSSGIKLDNSIYNAYCHLIRDAKHFIYIENQFFITSSENDSNYVVKNRIGEFIVERVKRAHKNNEKFRIIVVMPLLPAFEADLSSKDAGTIRMVMHWQYVSICRGGKSLLEKISAAGINPEDYISFFALRGYDKIHHGHGNKGKKNGDVSEDSFSDERQRSLFDGGRIGGEPAIPAGIVQMDARQLYVTEEVYIHSKLMIVDDRFVICGSANINDRSQLGNRDSEIAIVIEDKKNITTRMNGKEYQAGKFAYKLRCSIFKEHLGLCEPQDHSSVTKSSLPPMKPEVLFDLLRGRDESITEIIDDDMNYKQLKKKHPTKDDLVVMDPLSDEFYRYWQTTARTNSETFRSIFRCVPDKHVTSWKEYTSFVPDPTKVRTGHVANSEISEEETREKLSVVRGHLVEFPLEFLSKENLMGSVIQNAVTPAEIFT
ncbi:6591_t:CDS:10 [Funneliformis caledonium]|uniref:Phospholipase n=1 Tax=Funneliformis caledonium TaxID=1117310 RepID=A0A9N8V460_9GLOM|nr:6591_t:CDS:10 [Funneliformis caledonium]